MCSLLNCRVIVLLEFFLIDVHLSPHFFRNARDAQITFSINSNDFEPLSYTVYILTPNILTSNLMPATSVVVLCGQYTRGINFSNIIFEAHTSLNHFIES